MLFLASLAWADCPEPYSFDALLLDMKGVDTANRDGETAGLAGAVDTLEAGLACLDAGLNPALSPRIYRTLGSGLALLGRTDEARGWYSTAREVDPTFTFGVGDLSEGHPGWALWEATADLDHGVVEVEGELASGSWRIDGRALRSPKATVERPHILQRSEADTWTTWRIDGNAFPDGVIDGATAEAPPADKPGKSSKNKQCKRAVIRFKSFVAEDGTYCSATSPEQVVFTLGGPLIMGAGAVVYGEAFRQRGLTRDASTIADMERHKRINNRLVVASGAMAGVGAGVGIFGLTYVASF